MHTHHSNLTSVSAKGIWVSAQIAVVQMTTQDLVMLVSACFAGSMVVGSLGMNIYLTLGAFFQ